MSQAARTPIVYSADADIRFGDLDPYGHLNAKHYLDLVASARLAFMDRNLQFPLQKVMGLGIGFFLRSAEQHFRRPVTGICRVHVRSWVDKVAGAALSVPYEILSEDRSCLYADGTLQYVMVNLTNHRPVKCPAWLMELFLNKPGQSDTTDDET